MEGRRGNTGRKERKVREGKKPLTVMRLREREVEVTHSFTSGELGESGKEQKHLSFRGNYPPFWMVWIFADTKLHESRNP